MNRVLIIGCPGAGKSTFGRKLATITGLPLHYLDMLWHKPDRTTVSRDEFDRQLNKILKERQWIVDGNYTRTLDARLKQCDTVFLFDLPTATCLEGAMSRIGHDRPDMPWTETELDDEFRQWILNFRDDILPEIMEKLKLHDEGRQTVIFHTRTEADSYLESLV